MILPNFFIIGAPKCGTTSVSRWLQDHPEVFMSRPKEPHYFNTDLGDRLISHWKAYSALFRNVSSHHKAVGEASVYYLFSHEAVLNIEKAICRPKYIVLLRNPIDMAYSLHEQKYFSGEEPISDFMKAWALSPKRRTGNAIERTYGDPKALDYQKICKLGEQLERLLSTVGRNRVHIVFLEDLVGDVHEEYCRILLFLGLSPVAPNTFPVYNPAKQPRSVWLHAVSRYLRGIRRSLGINRPTGLLSPISRLNTRYRARPELSVESKRVLTEYYREDIQLLSKLLNRDLGHWLEL